ncbi:LytR family transcriptional regulator [Streptomyces armeniacus]|uniref:LytR family transcriptional regulator n=1 Tax=Streptomyces armeniacus TaxID=83291 RepID=A0A345XPZ1_9ACTN|nr:LCP family protein [Streptomyces armeniacus]AXK33707.1 LytR family transcriptional regulator [Streptomyces armeniacus]
MTDGYGYDPYGQQQPQILGYDEYGRPIYQQDQQQAPQQNVQPQQQPYGYDPYGAAADSGQQQPVYDGYDPYDPYGSQTGQQPAYDPYGPAADTGQQQPSYPYPQQGGGQAGQDPAAYYGGQPQQQAPQQHVQPQQPQQDQQQPYGYDPYGTATDTGGRVPRQAPPPEAERSRQQPEGGYDTEQFSFVEEETDDSEDVIDWLKFTESRTERREEAKRRGRNRKSALIVLLVLAMVGGLGYLWQAGKLPGVDNGSDSGKAAAGEKRDVLAVHLLSTDSDASSTALLVDNDTAKKGTTLLLPNSLAVSTADGGTTTLGKSVKDEGATPTRDALDRLFGAQIKGTWRLDTPYLEILVDSVGGIAVDTDTAVPGKKKGDKPLVERGKATSLDGRAAVAYATYSATGEQKAKQLTRFGQVMEAVLKKVSSDKAGATNTVKSLGQILDPSLSEESLGATLAGLSALAKDGAFDTKVLPVETNGTLSRSTSDGLVKDVLGGTVKNSDPSAAPTVSVQNASGSKGAAEAARVALVNGGFTVVDGGQGGGSGGTSQVTYANAAQKAQAAEVAKTLGLPDGAVRKGKGAGNADVTVVLGKDYKG